MKLSEFKFDLPSELIAQHPAHNRDESRLLVLHKETGKIEHKVFKDLTQYFTDGDVIVSNNTKVFPARLIGKKDKALNDKNPAAIIEVFLLRELNRQERLWDVLVDPARKIRVGNKLIFGDDLLVAEVIDNTTNRGRTIKFDFKGDLDEFYKIIHTLGETPIPRELGREVEPDDEKRYQTIFAEHIGAVAAPTAGLHFTIQLIKRLQLKNVNIHPITLHVGLGTFRSVEVEDLTKHKTDSESYKIPIETSKAVNVALDAKKKVCAVGTTVLKTIESSVTASSHLKESEGWTDKFIFPPYDFKVVNSLITNLHLPESTLLMMACAFGGYENVMNAYKVAIEEKYRFFTYGDAMLII